MVLGKEPHLAGPPAMTSEPNDGESYIEVPSGVQAAQIYSTRGPFRIVTNQRHELSVVLGTVKATTWNAAVQHFVQATSPLLDHLAFLADVPVAASRIVCTDKKNHVIFTTYTSPYRNRAVPSPGAPALESLLPFYALYREAKNSTSDFYRLLCYYKIIEGVYGHLRPQLMLQARQQGVQIETRREVVPNHPELERFSREHIGQPIKQLFDNYLQPEYRNTVAHVLSDEGAVLNVSDYVAQAKFSNIILLAELCARQVLTTQEGYEWQLRSPRGQEATAGEVPPGNSGRS